MKTCLTPGADQLVLDLLVLVMAWTTTEELDIEERIHQPNYILSNTSFYNEETKDQVGEVTCPRFHHDWHNSPKC